ncbi:MAG: molybdopterin-dependent oxidoreductase, partial [Armatimonadota bacterium]|nr:molybdopterin-dependent oxidoreductase [Armatimonadota bacterium]
MAVTRLFGASVKRRDDPQLITGRATYTDDVRLAGAVYATVVRSPHAHARIVRIETARARAHPGVVAVYTGRDLEGRLGPVPCAWLIPNANLKVPRRPVLAVDRVRYVGEGVAVVLAESRYAARDAADLVEVAYEPLPAVVDQEKAAQAGAPQLHDDVPGNLAFTWKVAGGDVEAAFRQAEVVVRQRFVNHRLIPNAMETRAVAAQPHPATGEVTVWLTSQNPHIHRSIICGILGLPEHKVRVIAPEVGGGFGSKIHVYPEDALIPYLARELGRPVKWTEDRRENYVATIHGRDHVTDLEIAARRDGTIRAIRGTTWANMGAYLSTAAPGIPTILHGLMLSGCYTVGALDYTVHGVFTTTTPVDAYRGAGRPEATYLVERAVDLVAREVGRDPAEVRRRNFIPKDKFPYTVASGIAYDSGDYEGAMERALRMIDYDALRGQQAEARRQGRYLGVGLSTYVEICGAGPPPVMGAVGFQIGGYGSAVVRLAPTGKVWVFIGESPHGQGEETTFAQVTADRLGVPLEDVEVVHGDTTITPMGWGTYGSRTTVVGTGAIVRACDRLIEKGKKIAAHLLEAAESDIVFEGGRFFVRGAPDRVKTIQEVTLAATLAWNLPAGVEPGMEATAFFAPSDFTYPFGAHVCTVEVDPETGEIRVVRYVAVDDCGNVINPLIVDGQVHGGITQGIAQALYETAVYDSSGQLLSASMSDYTVPKAFQVPRYETDRTVTPSPHQPLGIKGVGETGTIAATAAVANAVADALAPLGIAHLDMPFTPR